MTQPITIRLTFARATKNTYRFEGDDPRLRVLYVDKSTYPGGPPAAITVTLSH